MAWEFLEWLDSAQGMESASAMRVRSGFPTRIDVFERELEEAMGESGEEKVAGGMTGFRHNGVSVDYRKTTHEEAQLIHSLIESAAPERSAGHVILGIIEEETAYLYDGSKTAEDVAAVTQNRVQLYLEEQ